MESKNKKKEREKIGIRNYVWTHENSYGLS